MDNFESDSLVYQVPSIVDQNDVIEEQEQFVPLSLDGHNENLAEVLPPSLLAKISADLMEGIEDDLNSRKDWEDTLVEGIEFLGLKIDKKIQYPFEGASGSYSSVMMEAIQNFLPDAVAELLPLEGPAKQLILGDPTDELEDQANRIESFFNMYLTEVCKEYYKDMKQMLIWVGLGGTTFRKTYFDPILKRVTSSFIMPQDFIVNYGTTNLETCWRMTEVLSLNKMEVLKRKMSGSFIDIDLTREEGGEESKIEKAVDDVQGTNNTSSENKINYTFYECHTNLDIGDIEIESFVSDMDDNDTMEAPSQEGFRPYRVTIHKQTKKIVSIYRNWEEGDDDFKRVDYYTKYGYSQGLGFYDFGAAHLIGSLAYTSTTCLRQTLDGQTLNNFPGGLRVKGLPLKNNNIPIGPCEWIEVDTGGLPIQQAIAPMPYKEPSPAINVIRNELEGAAARIMGSVNKQIPDFNANSPVGTTLALLEVSTKVQSTVLRGLRDSMSDEFKKFYYWFSQVLPENPWKFDQSAGSSYISRNDFVDQISMIPVADPHVTTKMQRMVRAQSVVDLSNQSPDLYNRYEAQRLYLKEIKLTDSQIDKVLPNKDTITPLDPVTENQKLMMGQAAKAGIDQDHASHLVVHEFMLQDPSLQPNVVAATLAHIAQHKALQFQIQIQQMTGLQLPSNPEEIPPEMQNQIAMMAAEALTQQQQQQQADAPAPLLDPAAVMLEKVKVEDKAVEMRNIASERETEVKAFEAQLDYDAKIKALEIKEQELELKAQSGKI